MASKVWKCTGCGLKKPIVFGWNNRFQEGRDVLCAVCNSIRKRKDAQAKPKPVAMPRKPIAKRSDKQVQKDKRKEAFNRKIWKERPHVCFETGQPLGEKPRGIFFSHVHSKGARPDLQFNPANIVLHSPTAHDTWEFGDRSTMPKTQELFDRLNLHDQ
jgi:hypothetical protein